MSREKGPKISKAMLRDIENRKTQRDLQPPKLNPKIRELSTQTAINVIIRESNKDRIPVNPTEIALWRTIDEVIPAENNLSQDELLDMGVAKVEETLRRLPQSRNMLLAEAGQYLSQQVKEGNLIIVVAPAIIGTDEIYGERSHKLGVQSKIDDGKIVQKLDISAKEIASFSYLRLAIALLHESTHIKDNMKFLNGLPAWLTDKERMREANRRTNDVETVVSGEAIAYGTESEALIRQFGYGFDADITRSLTHNTAAYIQSGRNTSGEEWQNYVRDRIMQIAKL